MRTSFFSTLLLLVSFLFFTQCQKQINTTEPDNPSDSLTHKEQLLTSHTWKYNEYFSSYSQTNALVTYKIAKPNNKYAYDILRVTYNKDKTYVETTLTGDTLQGTWELLNNETEIKTINRLGSNTSKIIVLNDYNFIWNDYSNDTYGKMIPSTFAAPNTIDTSKLSNKKWIYDEYFMDFTSTNTKLAFKVGKPNNFYDLSLNKVTFHNNGIVAEINENGNYISGSWSFTNSMGIWGTTVTNSTGTNNVNIIYLDDSSFVWYNVLNKRFAKMKLDTGIVAHPPLSPKTLALCNKDWIYTEYFDNYTYGASTVFYKRDKQNNNLHANYGQIKVKYFMNGTYTEYNELGQRLNGTWQFLDNETKIKTTYANGSNTSIIIKLDSANFIWNDTPNDTYGKMVPAPYSNNYSIDVNKLRGKTWKYYEYFSNYTTTYPMLVYKREKNYNQFNLSINRVTLNANGTFSDYNENGQYVTGTWQILSGNKIQFNNNLGGQNLSQIINVTDSSFIWHDINNNTYGKMIPQ